MNAPHYQTQMRPVSSSDLREDALIPIRVLCSRILCDSHFNCIYLFVVPFYLTFYATFFSMFSPLIITPRSSFIYISTYLHILSISSSVYIDVYVCVCMHVCLSLSNKLTKTPKLKITTKKRMPNWNKIKPKAHRKSWNWFCVGLLCSMYYVHGSCPGLQLI